MFTAWILLMLNSLFFTLRLSGGGSGSFPRPLKAEEERMYLERMAQGDLEARNILIEHNLRLVAHIMKKYYTPNGDQDDLISIGTIGLIKGISTFKPDKNVRLATYASRCIENEILMHFRAQRKLRGEVSLSDSIDGDGDGNSLSLMDTISVDDNMLEELDARDSCAKVRRCVKRCLDERFHLPHGRLNALILPHVIHFNAADGTAAEKYGRLARLCGLAANPRSLAAGLNRLRAQLKLPERLSACGVEGKELTAALDGLAEAAQADLCAPSNPRPAAAEDLKSLLRELA